MADSPIDLSAWEAEFTPVILPPRPNPRFKVEAEECPHGDECQLGDQHTRYTAVGNYIMESAYGIAVAIGTLRAHGDEEAADYIEGPFREMLKNYSLYGAYLGYWPDLSDEDELLEEYDD